MKKTAEDIIKSVVLGAKEKGMITKTSRGKSVFTDKEIKRSLNGIPKMLRKYKVPERFILQNYGVRADLKEFVPSTRKDQRISERGIYLSGSPGTGKTTELVEIIKAYLKKAAYNRPGWEHGELNDAWRFVNLPEFMANLLNCISMGEPYLGKVDSIIKCHFLILDDIGVEKVTEFSRNILYQIINGRSSNYLPTYFTSNLSLGELKEKIDERLTSRIAGMCEVLELDGADKRLTA